MLVAAGRLVLELRLVDEALAVARRRDGVDARRVELEELVDIRRQYLLPELLILL